MSPQAVDAPTLDFLAFPAEIRNTIYHRSLSVGQPIEIIKSDNATSSLQDGLSFLCANKQVYTEAHTYLEDLRYRSFVLRVPYLLNEDQGAATQANQVRDFMTTFTKLREIRHLQLDMGWRGRDFLMMNKGDWWRMDKGSGLVMNELQRFRVKLNGLQSVSLLVSDLTYKNNTVPVFSHWLIVPQVQVRLRQDSPNLHELTVTSRYCTERYRWDATEGWLTWYGKERIAEVAARSEAGGAL